MYAFRRFALVLCFFLLLQRETVHAQWQQSLSLEGVIVYALAVSETNIFAGTGTGVFLSTNSGTSWTAIDSGLTNIYVLSLAVSGTNLFAGTYGGGVFRSTNNGTD